LLVGWPGRDGSRYISPQQGVRWQTRRKSHKSL
jgi:hypothetical protein